MGGEPGTLVWINSPRELCPRAGFHLGVSLSVVGLVQANKEEKMPGGQ